MPSLLEPLDADVFSSDYREQRPLHIERSDLGYFSRVVSTEKIVAVFSSASLYYPDVQLTESGCDIPASDYSSPDGLIDPGRFFARYVAGATVIISGSDRLFPEVAALCRQASQQFAGICRANLYLSPPGHQGFAPHYDTHDVLVLQVAGQKTFRLYENNISLPYPDDSFEADGFVPGEVTEEIALSAGDTFYIPRGVTHDACAGNDSAEPSLHLTLGLYPPLLRDVLHRIVDKLADSQVDLRRSVSSTDWQYDGISDELLSLLSPHFTDANLRHCLPEVMREFRDDVALAGLSTAHRAATLFPDTALTGDRVGAGSQRRLLLNRQRYLGHETQGDILYCRTFGQVLEFCSPQRQVVESWLSTGDALASNFTGTLELPLAGGDEVMKSLLDSGLARWLAA